MANFKDFFGIKIEDGCGKISPKMEPKFLFKKSQRL